VVEVAAAVEVQGALEGDCGRDVVLGERGRELFLRLVEVVDVRLVVALVVDLWRGAAVSVGFLHWWREGEWGAYLHDLTANGGLEGAKVVGKVGESVFGADGGGSHAELARDGAESGPEKGAGERHCCGCCFFSWDDVSCCGFCAIAWLLDLQRM